MVITFTLRGLGTFLLIAALIVLVVFLIVMYYGEGSDAALALAFKSQPEGGSVMLPGVVSRKKQLIPPLMATLG